MPEDIDQLIPEELPTEPAGILSKLKTLFKFLVYGVVLLLLIAIWIFLQIKNLNEPTENFPVDTPINIPVGTEIKAITKILADSNYVKSDTLLYFALITFYEPKDIKASTYVFDQPLTTMEIAERLIQGDFDSDLVRFTHFEGERTTILAKRASEKLPNFNSENFLLAAIPLEGKLFPETYFIPVDYDEEQLISLLTNTYEEQVGKLRAQIEASRLTEDEVIILASVIEREANSEDSKKMVSGILQNRLEIDMPLQADASIEYILDKTLAELTPEDLKIDSPYNTYLNRGLPPTPIGNPGLEAIMAVIEPTQSDFLFYITDEEGEFHYAKTYPEHLKNIEQYLR